MCRSFVLHENSPYCALVPWLQPFSSSKYEYLYEYVQYEVLPCGGLCAWCCCASTIPHRTNKTLTVGPCLPRVQLRSANRALLCDGRAAPSNSVSRCSSLVAPAFLRLPVPTHTNQQGCSTRALPIAIVRSYTVQKSILYCTLHECLNRLSVKAMRSGRSSFHSDEGARKYTVTLEQSTFVIELPNPPLAARSSTEAVGTGPDIGGFMRRTKARMTTLYVTHLTTHYVPIWEEIHLSRGGKGPRTTTVPSTRELTGACAGLAKHSDEL